MQKTIYEDNKFCMQDVANVYVGTKYTLGELIEDENIVFKFRLVVERYILPEADPEDTLETELYYLQQKGISFKIYKQLKARVKINILEDRKKVFGGVNRTYVTRTLAVEELAAMPVEEKEAKGVVVQELVVSKLALMSF